MTTTDQRPHLSDAALGNIDAKLAAGNWAVTTLGDAIGEPPLDPAAKLFVVIDLEEDDGPFAEMATQTAADAVMTALNAAPALVTEVRFLRTLVIDLLDVAPSVIRRDCTPVFDDGTCGAHGWGGTLNGRPCPFMRAADYLTAAPPRT